jgi:hypothetical protein
MGTLRHVTTGQTMALEPEHLVGRRPRSDTNIHETYVSVEHASIRWGSQGWEVRDLDSLNGTLVNGQRIRPRQASRLRAGDRITFARAEQTWELVDDSAPRVLVVALANPGAPIFIDGDILALPSDDDPRATVFRDADGAWYLEQEHEVVRLSHHAVFETSGHAYRFSCPDVVPETSTVDWHERPGTELSHVRLLFRVSQDEEHVELLLERTGGEWVDLGSRTFNYALLLLARQRLSDAADGIQESACGWMYQDDLLDGLKISSERLNIDIFRIRTHFAGIGVLDAAKVVERRPRSRQLRIGIVALTIQTI